MFKKVSLLQFISTPTLIILVFSMAIPWGQADRDDDIKNLVGIGLGVAAGIAGVAGAPVTVVVGLIAIGGIVASTAYTDCDCANCTNPCSCSDLGCRNNDGLSPGCSSIPRSGKGPLCRDNGACGGSGYAKCSYSGCSCS